MKNYHFKSLPSLTVRQEDIDNEEEVLTFENEAYKAEVSLSVFNHAGEAGTLKLLHSLLSDKLPKPDIAIPCNDVYDINISDVASVPLSPVFYSDSEYSSIRNALYEAKPYTEHIRSLIQNLESNDTHPAPISSSAFSELHKLVKHIRTEFEITITQKSTGNALEAYWNTDKGELIIRERLGTLANMEPSLVSEIQEQLDIAKSKIPSELQDKLGSTFTCSNIVKWRRSSFNEYEIKNLLKNSQQEYEQAQNV